jgi:hypothetical protein
MPYSTRLRFVDARDVADDRVDFAGLDVRAADGDKLGDVDGFVIDPELRRAHYIVVDSGGWFRSRRYLVPIGHARLEAGGNALRLDMARDVVGRYPAFEPDRFSRMNDEELRSFETQVVSACCPNEATSGQTWGYERWAHYRQPAWWRTDVSKLQERFRPIDRTTWRDDEVGRRREPAAVGTSGAGGDVSPHFDGRAQPGDILGIETGGETTKIGDTAEDENERRRTTDRKK